MKAQGIVRALAAALLIAAVDFSSVAAEEATNVSGARSPENDNSRLPSSIYEPVSDSISQTDAAHEAIPVVWDAPPDSTPLSPPTEAAPARPAESVDSVESTTRFSTSDLTSSDSPEQVSDELAIVLGGTQTLRINGQMQIDALWFSQTDASRVAVGDAPDAFDFRRAWLMVSGETGEVFNYALAMDFAQGTATNGRPRFLDAFVGVKDLPYVNNLRVGHTYEPFSLERLTSSRYMEFLERSLANAFAPGRNIGIMIFSATDDERATWALGTFRASDNFGDDAGDQEGQTLTGRVTWLPMYDEAFGGQRYLHLGGGYSFRHAGDGNIQYRSRPEAFGKSTSEGVATPFFVDTGVLSAHDASLLGLEAVWVNGPLSVQGEWIYAPVDRAKGPDVGFSGGYIFVSYFLTGEHRPYIRQLGIMDRVVPHENFFRVRTDGGPIATGSGAWEAAFRVSHIDLSDEDVRGGELTDLTAGLNWYLTPYVRMKVNLIRSYRNGPPNGHSNATILGLRWDVDF